MAQHLSARAPWKDNGYTDAEHNLSIAELMKILKEDYSMKVSRNTFSDDHAMLPRHLGEPEKITLLAHSI